MTQSTTPSTFNLLCDHAREAAVLESVQELLDWDESTNLPADGGDFRADQVTCIAGIAHERRTDPRLGEWLDELADSPLAADRHSDTGATIAQLRRNYEKQKKLPRKLVEAISRATVLGQQAWVDARANDDFDSFAPQLTTIIDLKRQQAECVGYEESPYDALLDDYEPDARVSTVGPVLEALRVELVPLVAAISEAKQRPDGEIVKRSYPIDVQREFGINAATQIGFDFNAGRLDVAPHPFCCSPGPRDCRITTRYDEHFFPSAFFGTLHESGHGIYEQGLRADQHGLPPGTCISLGIHESQSRMWENQVGRSRAFWQHAFPQAQQLFPAALGSVTLDQFYGAINSVGPSLIRVEADEATYNLHIIVRFELEQALIGGDLSIADLPTAWDECYEKYLGISSDNRADGVLQDVHWSAGLIGYFPTYSLGNLYSSQFFDAANAQIGPLDEQFARGQFTPLRQWLGKHIHQVGQCYGAAELVEKVTGKPLSHAALMNHLRSKLEPLYGI